MASFSSFLPHLLKVEGGYQKLSNDTGNYNSKGQLVGTNFGISAKTYELWIKRPPTEIDMRNMLKGTAIEIYKYWYWDKIKGDYIYNQSIANVIVDHGVNAGTTASVKLVQKVLNQNFGKNLTIDGIIGVNTINAINNVKQSQLFDKIIEARIDYYKSLNSPFYNAWIDRLKTFFFEEKLNIIPAFLGFVVISLTSYLIYKAVK